MRPDDAAGGARPLLVLDTCGLSSQSDTGEPGEAEGGPKISLPSLGVGEGGVIGRPVFEGVVGRPVFEGV